MSVFFFTEYVKIDVGWGWGCQQTPLRALAYSALLRPQTGFKSVASGQEHDEGEVRKGLDDGSHGQIGEEKDYNVKRRGGKGRALVVGG